MKKTNVLPAGTTPDNMIKLIDVYLRKNTDADAKPVFNMGDSAYRQTKSALRWLGIIEENSCEFTKIGNDFAYSTEEERKKNILKIIIENPAYENLLSSIFSNQDVNITDTDYIVRYWGKYNFGSTLRNRTDGANFFGNLIEYALLGKFIKGVRGSQSRIEWDIDVVNEFKDLLNSVDNEDNSDENQINECNNEMQKSENIERDEEEQKEEYIESTTSITPKVITKEISTPNITINVDMSTWEEEKIKSFFKYAYGLFEEDEK